MGKQQVDGNLALSSSSSAFANFTDSDSGSELDSDGLEEDE